METRKDGYNSANDSKKTDKVKLPLIFWVGFVILFLISFFLVLKLGFLAVVTTLIIWVLFIFAILKFSFGVSISVFGLLLIFTISVSYPIFFANHDIANQSSSPVLEMTVIKSPQAINCEDEKSVLEIQAKNIGQKDLVFDEVKNHQYDFEICDGDKINPNSGRSCFPGIAGYLTIENFGKIKTGETKIIKIITPTKSKPDNAIASFLDKNKLNGSYKYYVSFVKIESPKKKPLISQSNIFTVQTNIMDPTNNYIKVKCRKDYHP